MATDNSREARIARLAALRDASAEEIEDFYRDNLPVEPDHPEAVDFPGNPALYRRMNDPYTQVHAWQFVWRWSAALSREGDNLLRSGPLPQGPMCDSCTNEFNMFAVKGLALLMHEQSSYFVRRVEESLIAHQGCTSGVGSGDIGWHDL